MRIEFPTFIRQFSYDRRGRITEKSDFVGTTKISEKYEYDKAGRLIATTDRNGKITRKEYDSLNRVRTKIDPLGGRTLFTYSSHGKLLSVTDAKGQITKFKYDLRGNKTKESRPLGNSLSYLYDPAGRLLQRIDGEGQAIGYFYNDKTGYLDGYILKKSENDFKGEHVKFSYDSHGRLAGYDDGMTKAIYTHDILGRRLKTEVDYKTFTSSHSYTYYRNGKKKSYTGPDGVTHNYKYTPINLLQSIDIEGVVKVSYQNYKWLKPEKITSPGMVREDTYDNFLRLTKRKTTAAGKTILDFTYEYNALDNIISKQSGDTITGYSYDDLQRLVKVDKNSQTTDTFTFDPVGNRLSTNKESAYTYDANNQLLAVGETSYTYDKNGNTRTKKGREETNHFEYNFKNELSKIMKNGVEISYYYDPFGRRLSKTVNGQTTWFTYSGEGLVAEFDALGKLITSYAWQPDSSWSTNPVMINKSDKYYFYHNNHLGVPHKLTDNNGQVVWQGNYDVYGAFKIVKEEVRNNLRFPGQYFDEESGLYYNWNRFYDPSTGRYITADPIGLRGGINLYGYTFNNPINYYDSTGLECDSCNSDCPSGRYQYTGVEINLFLGVLGTTYRQAVFKCMGGSQQFELTIQCTNFGLGADVNMSFPNGRVAGCNKKEASANATGWGLLGDFYLWGIFNGTGFGAGGDIGISPVVGDARPILDYLPATGGSYGYGLGGSGGGTHCSIFDPLEGFYDTENIDIVNIAD